MQTKILSVVLDQGRQKGLRYEKGIYANRTDIYGKPNIELVRYSSRKEGKRNTARKRTKTRNGSKKIQDAVTAAR
jgi:hypothetical protein